MTDKERILMYLVSQLGKPIISRPPRVHATYEDPQIGDLVICQSSGRLGVHPFTVGYVTRKFSNSHCWIREIGGEKECDISNELFVPIKGLNDPIYTDYEMLPGKQYRFYKKVTKAFKRGNEYWYRFYDIKFEKNIAIITVGRRGGEITYDGKRYETIPFNVIVRWNTKTTIKEILEELRKQGYGTREFERGGLYFTTGDVR
jgi:hypothetical protein